MVEIGGFIRTEGSTTASTQLRIHEFGF
jgi:hypothetical protein